jgi:UDP-N-acetylglucosamine 4-epimerase
LEKRKNILLTGGAGFIGSHIADALMNNDRVGKVRVLDNLATGAKDNIIHHLGNPKFEFIEGDIRDYDTCLHAADGMDLVCHQAALGSVPRSINDPLTSNAVNVTGTLNIFTAAKETGIKRVVFAASSSTYGDHPGLPKVEDKIGNPLSPYAVTKLVNELYARVYATAYGMEFIGLRYFNIFGPRQSPSGPYAAVIPLFTQAILDGKSPTINGDGSTSRDFTYVDNAVHANLLALFTENPEAVNQVYNIACGKQKSLLELFEGLKLHTEADIRPTFGPERKGDVKHSLADISKAHRLLGYEVLMNVEEGLKRTMDWFREKVEGV